jgi:hypothetical protein
MSLEAFYQFLIGEGYGELIALRHPNCISLLDHDLEKIGLTYRIVDRERTEVTQIWLETTDWEEARDYFWANLQGRFLHFLAQQDENIIAQYENQLAQAGIEFKRNDVPGFSGLGTMRYRLFVRGRDLKLGFALIGVGL